MKLSDYAKAMGVNYQTAWRWYKDQRIPGAYRIGKAIFVPEEVLLPSHNIIKIGMPALSGSIVMGKSKCRIIEDGWEVIKAVTARCYGRQRGRRLAEEIIKMLPVEWEEDYEEIIVDDERIRKLTREVIKRR